MKAKFLPVWIQIMCIVVLAGAGIALMVKNQRLIQKNRALLLQNDSILSVNLELAKYSEKLQCQLDSAVSLAGR